MLPIETNMELIKDSPFMRKGRMMVLLHFPIVIYQKVFNISSCPS